MSWRKFPVSLKEICIDTTLRCGQSFRWKKSTNENVWSCAIHGRLISLRQDATHLHYRAIFPTSKKSSSSKVKQEDGEDGTEEFLRHYLNLEHNLEALYEQWSIADANFKKKAPKFTGIRILRQDAWEALVEFICSSNNNISRISQMVCSVNPGPFIFHKRHALLMMCIDGETLRPLWSFDRPYRGHRILRHALARQFNQS